MSERVAGCAGAEPLRPRAPTVQIQIVRSDFQQAFERLVDPRYMPADFGGTAPKLPRKWCMPRGLLAPHRCMG